MSHFAHFSNIVDLGKHDNTFHRESEGKHKKSSDNERDFFCPDNWTPFTPMIMTLKKKCHQEPLNLLMEKLLVRQCLELKESR